LICEAAQFVWGDAGDRNLLRTLIREREVDSIFHFAASIVVPESVADPLLYYANNTSVTRDLLEVCVEQRVRNFIFSSTATVYSKTAPQPLSEDAPTAPASPYARSKLMTEWMIQDAARVCPQFKYTVLRYFNVAGADPLGRTGQSTCKATHLIKCASQVVLGQRDRLDVFGTDYSTSDGTAIRDYIHVSDLADAHLLALAALRAGANSAVYNCGYGRGASVLDVVTEMETAIGDKLPVRFGARRAGDVPMLVADSRRIYQELGWTPKYADLQKIVTSALAWEQHLMMCDHAAQDKELAVSHR
jgi:UDP-glucose 4-epimerase